MGSAVGHYPQDFPVLALKFFILLANPIFKQITLHPTVFGHWSDKEDLSNF